MDPVFGVIGIQSGPRERAVKHYGDAQNQLIFAYA